MNMTRKCYLILSNKEGDEADYAVIVVVSQVSINCRSYLSRNLQWCKVILKAYKRLICVLRTILPKKYNSKLKKKKNYYLTKNTTFQLKILLFIGV
jgi:hypothetical protein